LQKSRSLRTAIAPVLRRLYCRFVAGDPLLPSCLRRQRDLIEALEPRRLTDTPVGPALSVQYFTSTDPTAVAAFSGTVAIDQMYDMSSIGGSYYDASEPFHALFTGTLTTADAAPTTYYLQMPMTEGAVLTIDGQRVIYVPSRRGDANLDGHIDSADYDIVSAHLGQAGAWADGDFNSDGMVDNADLAVVSRNLGKSVLFGPVYGDTIVQAADPSIPIGFNLSAGAHTFSLDYYQFDDQTQAGFPPDAEVDWTKDFQNGNWDWLSSLNVSPYQAPKVTPASPINGFTGATLDQTVATFTQSAPNSLPSNYSATIQWHDNNSTETAEVLPAGGGTFAVVSHRQMPGTAGAITGSVTITHTSGMAGAADIAVNVAQPALHPAINGSTSVDEGSLYTLAINAHADVGASPASSWKITWGDGSNDTLPGTSQVATHTFTSAAAVSITATVTDGNGVSYSAAPFGVQVVNKPPTLQPIAAQTYSAGDLATISIGFTDPGTGDTHSATVNWNDGSSTEAANVSEGTGSGNVFASHAYLAAGTYTPVVIVTDSGGGSVQETGTVVVTNTAPHIAPLSPQTIAQGGTVYLSTTFSDTDPWDTHTSTVNWGDGTIEAAAVFAQAGDSTGTLSATHTYLQSGTFAATLTVTDGSNTSDSSTGAITVTPVAPTADAGPAIQRTVAGNVINLYGRYTEPDPSATMAFAWSVVDSTGNTVASGTDQSLAFTPAIPGSYTATFTVTDAAGGSATATTTIIASDPAIPPSDVPPTAPINLTVPSFSPDGVNITWQDTAGDADGYEIQWSQDGSNFYTIDAVGPNTTSYTDPDPVYNTNNYYRVVAYRGELDSTPTNTQSAHVITAPAPFNVDNNGDNGQGTLSEFRVVSGGTLQNITRIYWNAENFGGGTLSIAEHTGPAHGQLTLNSDGTFTYVADSNFIGTDTFTYTLTNGYYESEPATVAIDVYDSFPAVRITAANGSIFYEQQVGNSEYMAFVPLVKTSSADGSSAYGVTGQLTVPRARSGANGTLRVLQDVHHGQLQIDSNTGAFTYSAGSDFRDVDSFTVVPTDGIIDGTPYKVLLDAAVPWVANQSGSFAYSNPEDFPASNSESMGYGGIAGPWVGRTTEILQQPLHGHIGPNPNPNFNGELAYFPNHGYVGNDYVVVRSRDGNFVSEPETIQITVETYGLVPQHTDTMPGRAPDVYYSLPSNLLFSVSNLETDSFTAPQANFTFGSEGWLQEDWGAAASFPVSLGQQAQHGTVTLSADGAFSYNPDEGGANGPYMGADLFSFVNHLPSGVDIEHWVELDVGYSIPGGWVGGWTAGSLGGAPIESGAHNGSASAAASTPTTWQPEHFSNDLKGLWQQYMAAQGRLKDVLAALNVFGQAVNAVKLVPEPTDGDFTALNAAVDNASAKLDDVTVAYDRYTQQAQTAFKAAGNYMRDVWYFSQADWDVVHAIQTLPRDVAGIHPDQQQMQKWSNALSQYANGADFAVANNTFVVTAATETHDVMETAIQVGGIASIAVTGAELLAEEGCEVFAKYAVKQIVHTASGVVTSFATQAALSLAQQLGVPSDYIRIGGDSLQLFFLVKAARAQRKALQPISSPGQAVVNQANQNGLGSLRSVGNAGSSPDIRELPGTAGDGKHLFIKLTRGGSVLKNGPDFSLVKMPDGTHVTWRSAGKIPNAATGIAPPTIDINSPTAGHFKLKLL
jgi:hypothetical protein